jgi:hypothetical protein
MYYVDAEDILQYGTILQCFLGTNYKVAGKITERKMESFRFHDI